MEAMLPEPQGYFVSSLRVRRVLIPVPDILAYRCVTFKADDPEAGDIIVADQVAFDNVLITLGVYPKRNPLQAGYAGIWSRWHMDKILPQTRSDEPKETLLYRLDSPHRR